MTKDEEDNLMRSRCEMGTVSTRSSIIEKALKLGYIRVNKVTFYIDILEIKLIDTLNKLNIGLFKENTVEL